MDISDLHATRLCHGNLDLEDVETNALFIKHGEHDRGNPKAVRVYDLLANMPVLGKARPLTVDA